MTERLRKLAEYGQRAWVDDLSRQMIRSGELSGLLDAGVSGITSNPTIFHSAMTEGDAYDDQFAEVLASQQDPKEVFLALATRDIRDAADLLRPSFEEAGDRFAGWVSLEVDPRLADDTEATIAEAKRLRELVDRPNLFVKIPGTEAGIPAIEETVAAGIPVNVTLLFSLDRHRQAARAYQRGLQRLRDGGGDLRSVASVASFFVSRVDSEGDRRLDAVGGPEELRSKLAIANAKLAYQTYREEFSGPEWEELAATGARPQWCLWASTSAKDPSLSDVAYVDELIGKETVSTMPRSTIDAFIDHGTVAATLESGVDEAHRTVERFAEAGIDYDDLTATLERDGVRRFAESFDALFEAIQTKRDQTSTRGS